MSSTITQSYTTTSFETTTMKLRIPAQKPDPDDQGFTGRTFLEALPKPAQKKMDGENAYVSQRYNPSFCRILSEKSLELCTENLGCETGSSDTMDDADILSLSNISPRSSSSSYSSSSSSRRSENSSRNAVTSFPPPLTSMSNGRSSLQIRPRREEGRLVITAVAAPGNPAPCFTVERRDGRLTLTMTEYQDVAEVDSSVKEEMIQVKECSDEVASEEEEGCEESVEADCDFLSDEEYYYYHQKLDEDDDDHDEESGAFKIRDLDANIFDSDVELGMEKFQRLIKSRCTDRWPKGLFWNSEHLWVATS